MIYAKIIFIRRNGTDGTYYPLTNRRCLIGRHEECDIPIQLRGVADNHCQINVNEDGEISLTNLTGNSSSVSLNGSPVSNTVPLRQGDVFCIRERSFRFEVQNPLQKNPSNTSAISGTELTGAITRINSSDDNHHSEGTKWPLVMENTQHRNIETRSNSVNVTDGNSVEPGSSTSFLRRLNSSGLQMFHLQRIGPPASKPGVADVMDFWKVTSLIGRKAMQIDFLIDSSDYVQGAYVSRLHARMVRRQNNIHRLFDDSLNGVFVNNFKIAGHVDLQVGDRVTFGHPQGSKLPAGARVHQPDSEYQFMFEICSCPSDSRPLHQEHDSRPHLQEHNVAMARSQDAGTSLKVEMNEDISDQMHKSMFEYADNMQTEPVKKDDSSETGHDVGSNEVQQTGFSGLRIELDAVHSIVERMAKGEVEHNRISFQATLGSQQEEAESETRPSGSGLGSNEGQNTDHTGSVTCMATMNGNSVRMIDQGTVPNRALHNEKNPSIGKNEEFIAEAFSQPGLEAKICGGQLGNTGSRTEVNEFEVDMEVVDEEEVVQNESLRDHHNLGEEDMDEDQAKNKFDISLEQHQGTLISLKQMEPEQSANVLDNNVNVEKIFKCTGKSFTEIEKKESSTTIVGLSMQEPDIDVEFNDIVMKVKTELLAVSSQSDETDDAKLAGDETNSAQDQIYFLDSQVENNENISFHPNVNSNGSMGIVSAGVIDSKAVDRTEVPGLGHKVGLLMMMDMEESSPVCHGIENSHLSSVNSLDDKDYGKEEEMGSVHTVEKISVKNSIQSYEDENGKGSSLNNVECQPIKSDEQGQLTQETSSQELNNATIQQNIESVNIKQTVDGSINIVLKSLENVELKNTSFHSMVEKSDMSMHIASGNEDTNGIVVFHSHDIVDNSHLIKDLTSIEQQSVSVDAVEMYQNVAFHEKESSMEISDPRVQLNQVVAPENGSDNSGEVVDEDFIFGEKEFAKEISYPESINDQEVASSKMDISTDASEVQDDNDKIIACFEDDFAKEASNTGPQDEDITMSDRSLPKLLLNEKATDQGSNSCKLDVLSGLIDKCTFVLSDSRMEREQAVSLSQKESFEDISNSGQDNFNDNASFEDPSSEVMSNPEEKMEPGHMSIGNNELEFFSALDEKSTTVLSVQGNERDQGSSSFEKESFDISNPEVESFIPVTSFEKESLEVISDPEEKMEQGFASMENNEREVLSDTRQKSTTVVSDYGKESDHAVTSFDMESFQCTSNSEEDSYTNVAFFEEKSSETISNPEEKMEPGRVSIENNEVEVFSDLDGKSTTVLYNQEKGRNHTVYLCEKESFEISNPEEDSLIPVVSLEKESSEVISNPEEKTEQGQVSVENTELEAFSDLDEQFATVLSDLGKEKDNTVTLFEKKSVQDISNPEENNFSDIASFEEKSSESVSNPEEKMEHGHASVENNEVEFFSDLDEKYTTVLSDQGKERNQRVSLFEKESFEDVCKAEGVRFKDIASFQKESVKVISNPDEIMEPGHISIVNNELDVFSDLDEKSTTVLTGPEKKDQGISLFQKESFENITNPKEYNFRDVASFEESSPEVIPDSEEKMEPGDISLEKNELKIISYLGEKSSTVLSDQGKGNNPTVFLCEKESFEDISNAVGDRFKDITSFEKESSEVISNPEEKMESRQVSIKSNELEVLSNLDEKSTPVLSATGKEGGQGSSSFDKESFEDISNPKEDNFINVASFEEKSSEIISNPEEKTEQGHVSLEYNEPEILSDLDEKSTTVLSAEGKERDQVIASFEKASFEDVSNPEKDNLKHVASFEKESSEMISNPGEIMEPGHVSMGKNELEVLLDRDEKSTTVLSGQEKEDQGISLFKKESFENITNPKEYNFRDVASFEDSSSEIIPDSEEKMEPGHISLEKNELKIISYLGEKSSTVLSDQGKGNNPTVFLCEKESFEDISNAEGDRFKDITSFEKESSEVISNPEEKMESRQVSIKSNELEVLSNLDEKSTPVLSATGKEGGQGSSSFDKESFEDISNPKEDNFINVASFEEKSSEIISNPEEKTEQGHVSLEYNEPEILSDLDEKSTTVLSAEGKERDQVIASFEKASFEDVSNPEKDNLKHVASFEKESSEMISNPGEIMEPGHVSMGKNELEVLSDRDEKSTTVLSGQEKEDQGISLFKKESFENITNPKEYNFRDVASFEDSSSEIIPDSEEKMEPGHISLEKNELKIISYLGEKSSTVLSDQGKGNNPTVFLCEKESFEDISNAVGDRFKDITSFEKESSEVISNPEEIMESRQVSIKSNVLEVLSNLDEKSTTVLSDPGKERDHSVASFEKASFQDISNLEDDIFRNVDSFEQKSSELLSNPEEKMEQGDRFVENNKLEFLSDLDERSRKEEGSSAGHLNNKNPDDNKKCSNTFSYEKIDEICTAVCQEEVRKTKSFSQLETQDKMEISEDDHGFFDQSNTGDVKEGTFQQGCSQDLLENSSQWNVSRIVCTNIINGIASSDIKSIKNVESVSESGRKRKLSEILQENDADDNNGRVPTGVPLKKMLLPTENEHSGKSCSKDKVMKDESVMHMDWYEMEPLLEHKTIDTKVCAKNDTVDSSGCVISSIQNTDSSKKKFLPENDREIKNNHFRKYFPEEDQSTLLVDCGEKRSGFRDKGAHDKEATCIKDTVDESGSSMNLMSKTNSNEQQCLPENQLETDEEFAYGSTVSSKELSETKNHERLQDCTCNVAMNGGDCNMEPTTEVLRVLSFTGEFQVIDMESLPSRVCMADLMAVMSEEDVKCGKLSELVRDKDAELHKPASDGDSESSELDHVKGERSSALVGDEDAETSQLDSDKDAELSKLVIDKKVESSELVNDNDAESSELVRNNNVESPELVKDKAAESSELVSDKVDELSESVKNKVESSRCLKDKDAASSKLVMDKNAKSSELVMDKNDESSELVDKNDESSKLVDKNDESSELVMDKNTESSELVDKNDESSELVMDKNDESSELVLDNDAESSELVDKNNESSELVSDNDAESSELVENKDAQSSEQVKNKDAELSELVMDKNVGSSDFVRNKDAESSELFSDIDDESSELVMVTSAESSECVSDDNVESSELVSDNNAGSQEPINDKDAESSELICDKDSELSKHCSGKNLVSSEYGNSGSVENALHMNNSCIKDNPESLCYHQDEETTSIIKPCDESEGSNQRSDDLHTEPAMQPGLITANEKACKKSGCGKEFTGDVDELLVQPENRDKQGEIMQLTDKSNVLNVKMWQLSERENKSETKSIDLAPYDEDHLEELKPCSSPESEPLISLESDDWDANSEVAMDTTENDTDSTLNDSTLKCLPFISTQVGNENGIPVDTTKESSIRFVWSSNHLDDFSQHHDMSPVIPQQTNIFPKASTADQDELLFSDHSDDDDNGISSLKISALVDKIQKTPIVDEAGSLPEKTHNFSNNLVCSPLEFKKEATSKSPRSGDSSHFHLDASDIVDDVIYDNDDERPVFDRYRYMKEDTVSNVNQSDEENVEDDYVNENEEEHSSGNYGGSIEHIDNEDNENDDENFHMIISNDDNTDNVEEEEGQAIMLMRKKSDCFSSIKRKLKNNNNKYKSSPKKVRWSFIGLLDSPIESQKLEHKYQRHNKSDSSTSLDSHGQGKNLSYPDQSDFVSADSVLSLDAARSPSKYKSARRQLEYKVKGKSRFQAIKEKLIHLTKDSKEAISPLASSSSSQETLGEIPPNRSQHNQFSPEGDHDKVTTLVTRCKSILEKFRQILSLQMDVLQMHRVQALIEELGTIEKWSELPQIVIAVMGNTGDGKSSLMNALLGHSSILPTSGIRACTAVVVEVVQNNGSLYEGCIEFLTKEEWYSELERLIKDLTSSDGNLKKNLPELGTDQYVSYCKVKAVYGKIDKFEVLAGINKVTSHLGQKHNVKCKQAHKFRIEVERYIETQEPQSGGQFWPIVKRVQLRLPNCDVCKTGAVLVDLPGVRDSNAARDKIARDYLKNCSAIWVVSAIHRAIDDKTAQELLTENIRRQLLMDGQYGSVSFICTKSDQFENSEIIRTLKLQDKCKDHEQKISIMEKKKQRLLEEIKICKKRTHNLNAEIRTSIKECEDLQSLVQEIETQQMDSDHEQSVDYEPMEEAKVLVKEKEQEREKNKEAIKEVTENIYNYERQIQELETQIRQRRRKISHICASARNDYCREKIKQKFQSGLKEIKRQANRLPGVDEDDDDEEEDDDDEDAEEVHRMVTSLRVFCCSSTEYQKMKELIPADGESTVFNSPEETEIPSLQEYVHELTRTKREQYLERLIRGLGHCIFNFQSYLLDGGTECVKTRTGVKSAIERHLQDLKSMIQSILQKMAEDLESIFNDMIQPKFHEGVGQAAQEATDTAKKWGSKPSKDPENHRTGGLHWVTYKATIQRLGVYTSPTVGNIDFNEELAAPFSRTITVVWTKVFSSILWRILETVKVSIVEQIQHFSRNVSSELQMMGFPVNRIDHMKKLVESSVNYKLTEMVVHLKPLVTAKQRDISRILSPHVQSRLVEIYCTAASQTGKGTFQRMKQDMESGIDARRMYIFDDGSQKMMHELINLKTELVNTVTAVCDMLLEEIKLSFEPLWEDPSQSELLRDTFQQHVEEVCEEMRTIYRDASLQNTEEHHQSHKKNATTQQPPTLKRPQERKNVIEIVNMFITPVPEELTKMTELEVLKVEKGSNMYPVKDVKHKPGLSSDSGMHNPSDVKGSSGMDVTRIKMEVTSEFESLQHYNIQHPVPTSLTAISSDSSVNSTFMSMAGPSDVYEFGEASVTKNTQHDQTHTKIQVRTKQTHNSKAHKNVPPEVRIALENHMVKRSTEISFKHGHAIVSTTAKQHIENSSLAATAQIEAENSSRGSSRDMVSLLKPKPGTSAKEKQLAEISLSDSRQLIPVGRMTSSTSIKGTSSGKTGTSLIQTKGTTSGVTGRSFCDIKGNHSSDLKQSAPSVKTNTTQSGIKTALSDEMGISLPIIEEDDVLPKIYIAKRRKKSYKEQNNPLYENVKENPTCTHGSGKIIQKMSTDTSLSTTSVLSRPRLLSNSETEVTAMSKTQNSEEPGSSNGPQRNRLRVEHSRDTSSSPEMLQITKREPQEVDYFSKKQQSMHKRSPVFIDLTLSDEEW
ncbi:hypothetical protein CHS0354_042909 [Potamilus streckersoni]|uniref:FHA domain-containing protein n=1 Tax=Potamilus streckersoni TaxID=2493646 RepID=A0AAE0W7G1_9BIVA|nr:hypothetical protein CHS0354_042909 [Potamilus streckersoni]